MSNEFKNLVNGLYDLLSPITDADVRKRAIKSVLVMLGDDPGFVEQKQKGVTAGGESGEAGTGDDGEFNAKAARWMQRNNLTPEQIGHVFHIDGDTVELIADKIPGTKQGEKVINTYVLVGIRELLRSGEPRFDNELGRTECERMGTHGKTNHTTILKSPGKVMTGSVKTGWTLTAPGLTAGAELVKELAG
jgi:hypothetical protein